MKEGYLIIFIFRRNQLTAKGIHKHEGYNFCDRCHEQLYDPRVKRKLDQLDNLGKRDLDNLWPKIVTREYLRQLDRLLQNFTTLLISELRTQAWF